MTSREALNLSGEQEYHLSPLPGHDAAARVKLLPPEALSVRLQRPLELLIGGARDRPSRQQTLRATIDWSYGLLDPAERREYAYRSGSCRRPSHVERLRQRVVLIDGEQLADLMIEHVVGGHHLDPMARRPGPLAR